jgi:hypothetical protein
MPGKKKPGKRRRIVKPDAQAGVADRAYALGDKVATSGRLHRGEIAARIVEQSKAFMMPRGKHGVLYARIRGGIFVFCGRGRG